MNQLTNIIVAAIVAVEVVDVAEQIDEILHSRLHFTSKQRSLYKIECSYI